MKIIFILWPASGMPPPAKRARRSHRRVPPAAWPDPRMHPLWPLTSAEQREALLAAVFGGGSTVVIGPAGVGKSFILRIAADAKGYEARFAAPTASAASALPGGVTIHSLFGLIPGMPYEKWPVQRVRKELQSMRLLVIDEIGAVPASFLTLLSSLLQRIMAGVPAMKERANEPFGGVRLLLLGDTAQTDPIEPEDGELPRVGTRHEKGLFCNSAAYIQLAPTVRVFTRIYRQTKPLLLHMLACARVGHFTPLAALTMLAVETVTERCVLGVSAVRLVATRAMRDAINWDHMREFEPLYHFEPSYQHGITGPGEYTIAGRTVTVAYEDKKKGKRPPTHQTAFAVGMQAVFRANVDPAQNLFNGAMVEIVAIDVAKRVIRVRLADGREHDITEGPYYMRVWKQTNGRLLQELIVTFPLEPAWSFTIHFAQGKSMGAVYVHVDPLGFVAPSMIYVALSRVVALSGLFLRGVCASIGRIHPSAEGLAFLCKHGLDLDATLVELETESATRLPHFFDLLRDELSPEVAPLTREVLREAAAPLLTDPRWAALAKRWEAGWGRPPPPPVIVVDDV